MSGLATPAPAANYLLLSAIMITNRIPRGRVVAMLKERLTPSKPAESVLSQSGVNIVSMTPS